MAKKKVPRIEGLFTMTDDPRLIVSRCKKCEAVAFPPRPFCPNPDCKKVREDVEEIKISRKGTLYSYAIQVYPTPPPFKYDKDNFAVGIVDFPEGLRVWGIMTRMENLKIGMEVETTLGKLYEDDENEYVTWMWKPID